jgi:hypothetical protein
MLNNIQCNATKKLLKILRDCSLHNLNPSEEPTVGTTNLVFFADAFYILEKFVGSLLFVSILYFLTQEKSGWTGKSLGI